MDKEKERLYRQARRELIRSWLIWTLVGFPAGCLLYLVLHELFHMNAGFWMTSLLTAGYSGYLIGIVGGYLCICREDKYC